MLRIIQRSLSKDSVKERLEEENHAGSLEFIPSAIGRTYVNITKDYHNEEVLYFVITIPRTDYASNDNGIISRKDKHQILSRINRAFRSINGLEPLSISYNEEIEENANKTACVAHVLARYDNDGLLPDEELLKLQREIIVPLELDGLELLNDITSAKEIKEETTPKTTSQEETKGKKGFERKKRTPFNAANEAKEEQNNKNKDNDEFEFFDVEEETQDLPDVVKKPEFEYKDDSADSGEYTDYELSEEAYNFLGDLMADVWSAEKEKEAIEEIEENIEEDKQEDEQKPLEKEAANVESEPEITESTTEDSTTSIEEPEEPKEEIPFLNRVDEYVPTVDITNEELFYKIEDRFETTETTSSKEKLRNSFEQTIEYFTSNRETRFYSAQIGEISYEQFMGEVKDYVADYLAIPMEDERLFLEELYNAFFSYYKLSDAINDQNISDIKVLGPDKINVKVKGVHYTLEGTKFINDRDYMVFIKALLARNKVKTAASPIVLFTDTEYHPSYLLRFNLTLSELNTSTFPVLHVRKISKKKMFIEDLMAAGMFPKKVADYLKEKVKTSSIVFAGPPASGKSTALNAFVEEIPYTEAALCVQESDEIFAERHPNLMVQHIIKDRKGNVLYGLDQIGTNGLVCDVNYFVIGEIKGAEARTFLRASNTGNHVLCTIHSPSAKETIPRFADYVKYGSDYTFAEAERMLKDLEVIVYIDHFKIREIVEIKGYDDEKQKMIYQTVYKYEE